MHPAAYVSLSLAAYFPKYNFPADSYGLKWIRVVDDVWLPDPYDQRGVKWLTNMLYSNQFPQWGRVLVAVQRRTQQKTVHWGGVEGTIERIRSLAIDNGWELGQENIEGGLDGLVSESVEMI